MIRATRRGVCTAYYEQRPAQSAKAKVSLGTGEPLLTVLRADVARTAGYAAVASAFEFVKHEDVSCPNKAVFISFVTATQTGIAASGRPFFVMEYVRGEPITEYCDTRKLIPQERLGLFMPVCNAVQHAHQKGIIHRELAKRAETLSNQAASAPCLELAVALYRPQHFLLARTTPHESR